MLTKSFSQANVIIQIGFKYNKRGAEKQNVTASQHNVHMGITVLYYRGGTEETAAEFITLCFTIFYLQPRTKISWAKKSMHFWVYSPTQLSKS